MQLDGVAPVGVLQLHGFAFAPVSWISQEYLAAALSAASLLGGATPTTLLGRCRSNDHRSADVARERYVIACNSLVNQAHHRRTSERKRVFHVDRTSLLAGPL